MIDIRQILCPIDFSDYSRHALNYAMAIARQYEAALTLLHVFPLPAAIYAPGTPVAVSVPSSMDLDALETALKRFAETDAGSTVPLQFETAEGNPASRIVERARALSIDLIVMGSHGRSGFERFLLGSVTEKVIRKATCPVLTVPRPVDTATPIDRMIFRRILCAIDFSDASLKALEYALILAQRADEGAQLTLIHVVEVSPAPASDAPPDVEARALGAYVAAAAEARTARLQQLVPDNLRAGFDVDTKLAIGSAHREILRLANERGSDIIVLGTHGFGITQLMFGSTANHVVREARCPILTVR